MRTLNWKYHLGLVSLDVELADRTLSLSVSPVHAAIILHFQTKSEWNRCLCFHGWEGHIPGVAGGSESSGRRTETWCVGLDLPQGLQHPAGPQLCTHLLVPGSASPAIPSFLPNPGVLGPLLSHLRGLCRYLDADRAE